MMGRHKEEMQKFTRLAAAIGESVEDVCNMPDEERTQLMKVMHMEDEEGAGGGTKPENEGNHSKDEVEEDTPSKRSRRGKRKPVFDALFDWNNDDDFVDDTKKSKDTSGAAGSKDSGWLSVTDQPSTSSGLTASGRPSRHAAVKANARVECINRLYTRPQSHSRLDVSTDIEEFQSQEVQPRRKSMDHTSPIKRESTRLRSQIKGNSYEPNATANESKRDEDDKIAQLIDSLNGKLKMSPLIPHTQSPKDFMRDLDDLPLMDCNKLQRRIGIELKDDAATDSILSKHLKIVRNISSKGLVHNSRSPLSWQKVLSSRKKHLEVNLERNQVGEVDLTNLETNADAELTEKQKQKVETHSIARFTKKPSLSDAGNSISKLSLDGNAHDTLKEEENIFKSKRRRTSLLNLSTDSSHLQFQETKSFQSKSPADAEGKVLGNIRNILESSNVTGSSFISIPSGSSVITIPFGSSVTSQNSDLDVKEDEEIGKEEKITLKSTDRRNEETFKFFKSKNP